MIKWINVKDRLPKEPKEGEEAEHILVCLYGEYVHQGYFPGDKFWVDDDFFEIEDGDVTHWAKLNLPEKG